MQVVKCTNFGIFLCIFLCNFPIDKFYEVWYNDKFGAWQSKTRRLTKMSQYFNWLHSPTHFREYSVALISRPNVHNLWRVRLRNFLSLGFYLRGLLISFTSFLCFNYSTSWLFVNPLFIYF